LFPSSGRWYHLVATLSWPEVVTEFVEGTAEALGGSKTFKTQHGIVTLFHAPVVLLDSIIFVAATPLLRSLSQHFRDRAWIRVVPLSSHLFRTLSGHCFRTSEEALGRRPVPLRTEHRIN
jgi:hypothetical protein